MIDHILLVVFLLLLLVGLMKCGSSDFDMRRENEDTVNFRQFMRTLAHFRPFKKSKDTPEALNSREEKLRCEAFRLYL